MGGWPPLRQLPASVSRGLATAAFGDAVQQRHGGLRALPVSGRGFPVERCLPLVFVLPSLPEGGRLLMLDGNPFVRVGGPAERVNARVQCSLRGGLGKCRVMLRHDQVLAAGLGGSASLLGLLQFFDARLDSG